MTQMDAALILCAGAETPPTAPRVLAARMLTAF